MKRIILPLFVLMHLAAYLQAMPNRLPLPTAGSTAHADHPQALTDSSRQSAVGSMAHTAPENSRKVAAGSERSGLISEDNSAQGDFDNLWRRIPDNDEIFARTMDSGSPFYYPALMMRYDAGDRTLTAEEYHYLYYGYAFTDRYRPLTGIPAEDSILEVLARSDEPDLDGMLEIIGYASEAMKSDPFSPMNLNFLVYAYGAIGDTVNERINYDRMTKILAAIEGSGTGENEKSPMHVLRFSHAADLLTSRGLTIAKRTVVSKSQEFIMLDRRDGKNRGFYFDYSRIFWNKPDDTPKSKRKWKLNDWPIN